MPPPALAPSARLYEPAATGLLLQRSRPLRAVAAGTTAEPVLQAATAITMPTSVAVIGAAAVTAAAMAAALLLRHARRVFQTIDHIPPAFFERHRRITGVVVAVGDGDNFRMVHTPVLAFFKRPSAAQRTHTRAPRRRNE